MSEFIVTKTWLENYSNRGCWTRDQIESLGLQYPPTKGWKLRAVGTKISEKHRKRFEFKLRSHVAKNYIDQLDLFDSITTVQTKSAPTHTWDYPDTAPWDMRLGGFRDFTPEEKQAEVVCKKIK